ncbi:MAG TPA: methyltransferase domain-containing protein [Desulfobacterales bacterium]|nr:methyltransferase domain-containing protein [Desulfobacterales bacterium]
MSVNPVFSEYTGGGRLYVIVRGREPLLSTNLSRLSCCTGVEKLADDILVVSAEAGTNVDEFLRRTAGVTSVFGAEIVEARLGGDDDEQKEIFIAGFKVVAGTAEITAGAPGKRPVILEPGLAFGSGHHPSTRLMGRGLEHIAAHCGSFPDPVLDIGCGSGILSIICARLGGRHVSGLDINPTAVAGARRNVILNGLEDRVRISSKPIKDIKGSFDLVTANISPVVLFEIIPLLPGLLTAGGILLMAGMRGAQMDDLLNILSKNGLDGHRRVYKDGAWRGLFLQTLQT